MIPSQNSNFDRKIMLSV